MCVCMCMHVCACVHVHVTCICATCVLVCVFIIQQYTVIIMYIINVASSIMNLRFNHLGLRIDLYLHMSLIMMQAFIGINFMV